ncbi:MAG: transmembrane(s)protein, partial [candidate division WS6 bacterium 34_10]
MKTFLKRNWGKILLLLLLLTISILSFKTGYSYLSNDNYSPDLNPILTIKRSLQSPAWRGYRVLGFASESEQADIFRSILYYILDIFLPTWSLSQIFALLSFFVGSWFTALLTSNLVKKSKISRYSELAFLLSGVFYVSTLWTVWVYYQNMFPYITQFGFLPLLLWSIFEVVREFNWKNILVLFISSILFTSTFVIATLFVVDILVIIFLTILFAILFSKSKKEIVKKSIFTILIFISTQLFWILPFVHYTANVSGDIVDSYVNRSITSSVIDLESQEQNALNSAKLFTRTILEEDDNGEYIFDRADEYASYDFFNVVGMIPAFLTVILLIFSIVKKKWIYTVLSIVTFLTWFIIKNVNPPLGSIFVFLQNNIPLFKQVFRWASSKTGNIYLLLLSICAPIGFIYLLDFLGLFLKKPMKIVLYSISTLVIFLLTLFYAQYLFTGDLFPKRALIQIPNEYFQVKQYIEENRQEEERILYLPPANNNYFRTYDWGFWGSNFISYIIPNPIMDLSSAIGSKYGEKAMLDIQQAFRAKDEEKLNKIIAKYEIEYILVDLSLDEEGFTYSWDWGEVDRFWNNFELAYSTDNLYLYKTDTSTTEVLIESNSEDIGTFSFFDYSESPKISLNPEVYSNWDSKKGYLIAESEYLGDDILVSNVISESEIGKFPTLVNITDSSIYLYPALPTL